MKKQGFTLIELLIVVAIIGIIAAIAIPNLMVALQKGKQKSTMGDIASVGTAIESYIVDWAIAPGPGSNFVADLDQSWFIPFYIKVLSTRDSWGTLLSYTSGAGNNFDLYSVMSWGKNRIDDSMAMGEYPVVTMLDFDKDIVFSNGRFTIFPITRR